MTIESELNSSKWGLDLMAYAIEAKRQKRAAKGAPFDCFVLDQSVFTNAEGQVDEHIEVTTFFNGLAEKFSQIEGEVRIQLAMRVGELNLTLEENQQDAMHWFGADVTIRDGKMTIFIVDSVLEPMATNLVVWLIKMFFKEGDNVKIYTFGIDLFDDMNDGLKESLTKSMQRDKELCAQFTLDNLFHLSTLNVSTILANSKPSEKEGKNYHAKYYHYDNLPVELASILRNTQSWTLLNDLKDELKVMPVNKKGETLIVSAKRHSEIKEVGPDKEKKLLNMAIVNKKKSRVLSVMNVFGGNQKPEMAERKSGLAFIDEMISKSSVIKKPS